MIERSFPDGTRIASVEHADGAVELTLEADGKKVSQIYIVPMLMRIGAAVLRMDGIGGVETDEAYQGRGYARRLMELAVETMLAGPAAISTLFGIPNFYPKFGYATIGPEYSVILPLDDESSGDRLPPGWRFRPVVTADLPAVRRLYHESTRWATGSLVRHQSDDELAENQRLIDASPAATRIGRRAWDLLERLAAGDHADPDLAKDACRVLLDAAGEIVAYAWIGRGGWWIDFRYRDNPESFHLGEVVAADPAAADAIVVACRQWAAESGGGCEQVEMAIPPTGPVACAAAYAGSRFQAFYLRNGLFMGRVLDLGRLLRQFRPELSARARAAGVRFRGSLTIITDDGEATLTISPDGVSLEDGPAGMRLVVELPQQALARLCLGAYETGDVLARLPRPPHAQTTELLEALFPKRGAHVFPVDRF